MNPIKQPGAPPNAYPPTYPMEEDEINPGALLDTLYLDRKLIAAIAPGYGVA